MGLGVNCSSRIAVKMRSRVSAATGRFPLMACDTVVLATPARLATSLMVERCLVFAERTPFALPPDRLEVTVC